MIDWAATATARGRPGTAGLLLGQSINEGITIESFLYSLLGAVDSRDSICVTIVPHEAAWLVERAGRASRLTGAGEIVAAHAQRVLDTFDAMQAELDALRGAELGTLTLAASTTPGSYVLPSILDGNDPVAVYQASKVAISRARAGEGPTLLECMTYRFHGHVVGDAMEYQPAEERSAAMSADPVDRYRARLTAESVLSDEELGEIDAELAAEIDDAVTFAQSSPAPDPSELYTDVYSEEARS